MVANSSFLVFVRTENISDLNIGLIYNLLDGAVRFNVMEKGHLLSRLQIRIQSECFREQNRQSRCVATSAVAICVACIILMRSSF